MHSSLFAAAVLHLLRVRCWSFFFFFPLRHVDETEQLAGQTFCVRAVRMCGAYVHSALQCLK